MVSETGAQMVLPYWTSTLQIVKGSTMSSIAAADPRLIWSGAVSCESGASWVKPWGIPHHDQNQYPPVTVACPGAPKYRRVCVCALPTMHGRWLATPNRWRRRAGGQCHADPMIARLIRDLDADFVSVKIGINIYGGSTLSLRTFRPAVIGTIVTNRDGHPDVPLVVCSPIWSSAREKTPNAVGMTLERMRFEVAEAVESFRRRGDKNIYYVDGLKLFDASLAQYLPDDLHPDAECYRRMGENFLKEVFEVQGVTVG